MYAEFEEKRFEQPLNYQLADRHNLVHPSGQVGEAILGFDAALRTRRRSFWRRLGCSPLPGTFLEPWWWPQFDQQPDVFPRVKFNVFVQSKRPEFLRGRRCKEWADWGTDYFRYFTVEHQQNALAALAKRVSQTGVVMYASPAFHTRRQLWEAVQQGDLVDKTNFADAQKLIGHGRYTYAVAGSSGKAYSEPTNIESANVEQAITSLRERTEGQRWDRFIAGLAQDMLAAIETLEPGAPVREAWHEMTDGIDQPQGMRRDLYRISAFLFLSVTSWMVGLDEPQGDAAQPLQLAIPPQ